MDYFFFAARLTAVNTLIPIMCVLIIGALILEFFILKKRGKLPFFNKNSNGASRKYIHFVIFDSVS